MENIKKLEIKTKSFVNNVPVMNFTISDHQDNIVTESVLQDLFDNFDDIPLQELQDFINKFKKQ